MVLCVVACVVDVMMTMMLMSCLRRSNLHVVDSSTLLYFMMMMMMLRMVVMMTMMLMSCLRRNNLHVVDSSTLLYASGNLLHFLNTDTNKLRCVSIFVFLRPNTCQIALHERKIIKINNVANHCPRFLRTVGGVTALQVQQFIIAQINDQIRFFRLQF